MRRKFLSNLAFLLFLNLLVKPFWIFGIDRAVQNEVGAAAYGSYFALFNFALILNIFLDLGTSNFNNRNISQHQHLLGKYFPRIVALRLLLAFVYAALCLACALLLDYSEQQMQMLALLCLNQFLLSSILFLRSNIAGLQLFWVDSLMSVLDRLLMILLCGTVLWGVERTGSFRIEWFICLQTCAYAVTAFVALLIVLRKGGPFSMSWNPAMVLLVLKKSLPFALLILLMSVYGRIDSVLIERLLPDGNVQAGIYAQAFRLLDASNMMAYLFAVLLFPMFSRMLKVRQDIRPLVRLSSKLIIIPAVSLAVVCWLRSGDIMELMYHAHVQESGRILALLMFSLVPMAGAYIVGTLLTANGNLKQLNIIALIGVIFSLTLNFALIPRFGAWGAGITCLVTQSLSLIMQLVVARRQFGFSLILGGLKLGMFILPVIVVAGFLNSVQWLVATGIILTTGGIMTLISLIPEMRTIKQLRL